ncbi:hypothetical protein Q7C36_019649 [Tachysurus vachellii]|uniref:Ryanodine Receptor TM 4-6 domain-containing protein n=1 Tax=Tachysurus vachellii TaxID=175792 RepID=A0AA88LS65_TACVA|nr:hypothetical protein Q7C36_019649 [Tachysurus vachellii]
MGDTTPLEPPTPEGSPLTKRKMQPEEGGTEQVAAPVAPPPEPEKSDDLLSCGLTALTTKEAEQKTEEPQEQVQNYLSRNFYNLRFLALFIAFALNFILLFYRVSDTPPGDELEGVFEGSGLFEGSGEQLDGSGLDDMGGDDDDDGDDEGPVYYFLEESTGYMQPTLSFLAIIHTVISFICIIGYNCLKIPLVIFKREKELARKLEFDGLYITDQPEDDDIKGQWDRLVLNTPSFPNNYWDKICQTQGPG